MIKIYKSLTKDRPIFTRKTLSKLAKTIRLFVIPMLTVAFSYLAIKSTEESAENALKESRKSSEIALKATMEANNEALKNSQKAYELALLSHKESIEVTIKNHTENYKLSKQLLDHLLSSHEENLKQSVDIYRQNIENNYKNIVHQQDRERYYQVSLQISRLIPSLKKQMNFCNKYNYEIRMAHIEEKNKYRDSLILFGKNFIENEIEKHSQLGKTQSYYLASEALSSSYSYLQESDTLYLSDEEKRKIEDTVEFKRYLKLHIESKKFYQYLDKESILWEFIHLKLRKEGTISYSSNFDNPKYNLEKLKNKFNDIYRKDDSLEEIYIIFKQLQNMSSLADFLFFSELQHLSDVVPTLLTVESYYKFEDLQYTEEKGGLFKTQSELYLFSFFELLLWNKLFLESTSEYMRYTSYEEHINNQNPTDEVFNMMLKKLNDSKDEQKFFIYRCESAYAKSTEVMSALLSALINYDDSQHISNDEAINYFSSVYSMLSFDSVRINERLNELSLIGPDSKK
ncbi:hypothetical protein MHN00_12895 [Alteromonas sp. Cnat2-8]|uniref:hypothetical protein n=1 Tax=Alteromonas sp. Cnat2-8 TaxID=2917728 RepID=UPI001EF724E3|nr:hypothetical protein [Alteromonas sp. Cnat2-8]MCG7654455.1 hypothetical protein [Alteromonas sp. Cnat2-8]